MGEIDSGSLVAALLVGLTCGGGLGGVSYSSALAGAERRADAALAKVQAERKRRVAVALAQENAEASALREKLKGNQRAIKQLQGQVRNARRFRRPRVRSTTRRPTTGGPNVALLMNRKIPLDVVISMEAKRCLKRVYRLSSVKTFPSQGGYRLELGVRGRCSTLDGRRVYSALMKLKKALPPEWISEVVLVRQRFPNQFSLGPLRAVTGEDLGSVLPAISGGASRMSPPRLTGKGEGVLAELDLQGHPGNSYRVRLLGPTPLRLTLRARGSKRVELEPGRYVIVFTQSYRGRVRVNYATEFEFGSSQRYSVGFGRRFRRR